MQVIDSFTGQHFFLSNFYESPLMYGSLMYTSVEHAFQTAKTIDPVWREKIRDAPTPGQAKRLGRDAPLREAWEAFKLQVMRACLMAKFGQNTALGERLEATGNAMLIEGNDWGDRYWGESPVGNGQNWLGWLLMAQRAWLQSHQH